MRTIFNYRHESRTGLFHAGRNHHARARIVCREIHTNNNHRSLQNQLDDTIMKCCTVASTALLLLLLWMGDCNAAKRVLQGSSTGAVVYCDEGDSNQCPDGSFVGRDASNNCEFETCPQFQCCDWKLEPGKYGNDKCESGSHVCCRNGEWGCAISGTDMERTTFSCGGVPTSSVEPFPEACPCCEPDLMPVCRVGEPQCCGDNGRWACPINQEGTEYNCGDVVLPKLDGPLCIIEAKDPKVETTTMSSASPNDNTTPP
jgi:hypothetical protein